MGGSVLESFVGTVAVGDCGESGDDDRGNSTGAGCVLQDNFAVGVVIWEIDLGDDMEHAKVLKGFHH